MGCASSQQAAVSAHHVPPAPPGYHQTNTYQAQYKPAVVVVKHLPDAPPVSKSRKSSSSSSSSSSGSESVDLNLKRKQIKEASAAAAAAAKSSQSKPGVELTAEVYEKYQSLNAVIRALERKNIIQQLETSIRVNIEIKNQAVKMNAEYKQLQEKMQKELQDVQNLQSLQVQNTVKEYFETEGLFDTQMSKEQEEYIAAKTAMEDCYKVLLAMGVRQSKLDAEIKSLQADQMELMSHYRQQDEILDSIFSGDYGSELEDKLESDLDKQLEKKQRIEAAMLRWKRSLTCAKSAYSQLSYAHERWVNIEKIPILSHQMLRIQATAEVRNYLIAAAQNLSSANKILFHVKLPYCDEDEVKTLYQAITFIFMDCMNASRHAHASNVYRATRDRCAVLVQWMSNVVLSETVQKDLDESRKQCEATQKELRAERNKLMREKIETETGIKIDADDDGHDSGVESEEEPDNSDVITHATEDIGANELDQQIKEAQDNAEETDEQPAGEDDNSKPAPLPLDELAPAPNSKALFGDLEVIMANYDRQKEEYNKELETNRAKQQADLQMKLQARRSRKRRMMAQQQELNVRS